MEIGATHEVGAAIVDHEIGDRPEGVEIGVPLVEHVLDA